MPKSDHGAEKGAMMLTTEKIVSGVQIPKTADSLGFAA